MKTVLVAAQVLAILSYCQASPIAQTTALESMNTAVTTVLVTKGTSVFTSYATLSAFAQSTEDASPTDSDEAPTSVSTGRSTATSQPDSGEDGSSDAGIEATETGATSAGTTAVTPDPSSTDVITLQTTATHITTRLSPGLNISSIGAPLQYPSPISSLLAQESSAAEPKAEASSVTFNASLYSMISSSSKGETTSRTKKTGGHGGPSPTSVALSKTTSPLLECKFVERRNPHWYHQPVTLEEICSYPSIAPSAMPTLP